MQQNTLSKLMSPEEAQKRLKEKGFIKLPAGSYYTWIEQEWFEQYKASGALVYSHGMWLPHKDKLHLLNDMDAKYKTYQEEKNKREWAKQRELLDMTEQYHIDDEKKQR